MSDLLERLLAVPSPTPVDGLAAWRARHQEVTAGIAAPMARAVIGGAAMDRIGYAFASGYGAALERLVPGLVGPAVLAATEAGGAHPRAIETRLTPEPDGRWRLDGAKSWCTYGPHAERLLVVARTGEDAAGRPVLRMVDVPREAPGVTVTPLPELPFVPEIPHAALTLEAVIIEPAALLPGDGYSDYLKPFRTIEDLHVFGALAGHMVVLTRGQPALLERSVAMVATLEALGDAPPSAPSTHLALGAVLIEGRALVDEVGRVLAERGGEVSARWARDRPLLEIAGKARRARLEAAHRAISGDDPR